MKLVVFGATGGTGKRIVELGLAAGHDVTAVARRPEAVTASDAHLRVAKGDVLDAASVAAAISGGDAVLSAFGPANNKQPGTLISVGVANIIAACAGAGVKRLVFESGLMVGDAHELSMFGKLGVAIYRALNRKLCDDKRIAEAAIVASSLDWVIIRPPALDDAPARGYISGVDARVNPAKKSSHADVADFMIKAAADPAAVKTVQNMGR